MVGMEDVESARRKRRKTSANETSEKESGSSSSSSSSADEDGDSSDCSTIVDETKNASHPLASTHGRGGGGLMDAIFGNAAESSSSSTTKKGSGSLLDAVFGGSKETPTTTTTNSHHRHLFDAETSEKYRVASRDRRERVQRRFGVVGETTDGAAVAVDRDSASASRARRRCCPRASSSERTITVDLSDHLFDDDLSEEDARDAARGIARVVRGTGVAVLRSGSGRSSLATALLRAAASIETEVRGRLEELGLASAIDGRSAVNDENDTAPTLHFRSVASRCPGRLDVRRRTDATPFSDPRVAENRVLLPAARDLLGGDDARLVYVGVVYSFPGSVDQPWHVDGSPLFPESRSATALPQDTPPYALNVFLPLSDVTDEAGPTEFVLASHLEAGARSVDEALAMASDGRTLDDRFDIVAPLLRVGDVIVYDYRVCHRGTSNLGTTTRTMLYLMYARPWFKEHLNFGTDPLFEDEK